MAEPQRPRPVAGIRRTSEVVPVLDPARILKGRAEMKLTQTELGRRCGKTRQAIAQIEAGDLVRIKPSFARDLTRELKLEGLNVFGLTEPATPSSASARGER